MRVGEDAPSMVFGLVTPEGAGIADRDGLIFFYLLSTAG